MFKKLWNNIKQKSTLRGAALIGAAAVAATGNADLLNVQITESGMTLGGSLGALASVAVPTVVGTWEAFRDSEKGK